MVLLHKMNRKGDSNQMVSEQGLKESEDRLMSEENISGRGISKPKMPEGKTCQAHLR